MSIESYGKYELLKRLATGGMAQIFLARAKGADSDQLLVVKRILPHLAENEDFVRMFLDEARIAARLNHPNIVQIFDLGAINDSYFIAMEYIHGEDVRRVWKKADAQGHTFPLNLVCKVVMDASSGLHHAHRKLDPTTGKPLGIVHRDVSPQNILMTYDGEVKVVDFGIAKAADQATVTKSGVLKGKYSYMSPEQAAGKRLDQRSDIFALGVVLYELLTGTRLFKRHNEIQTLNAVTECRVDPPSQVNTRVPKDLDVVVLKALSRNPNDRYQDALALQAALEGWLRKNGLQAGAPELSEFMHGIYAERLAREAREGRVAVVGSDMAREERAKKRIFAGKGRLLPRLAAPPPPVEIEKASTSPLALRAPVGAQAPTVIGEPTAAFDPVSATRAKPEDENSWGTRPLKRPSRPGAWKLPLATVTLLVLVGVGLYVVKNGTPAFLKRPPPPLASVRISSEPAAAKLVLDGKPLDQLTPVLLAGVPAGMHQLLVTMPGFEDHQQSVTVPATGLLEVPLIRLQLVPVPVVERPSLVTFTLRSEPTGAQVALAGTVRGKTPLALELPPNTQWALNLSLAGHKDLEHPIRLSEDAFQTESVTLEPVVAKKLPVKTAPTAKVGAPVEDDRPRSTIGIVRFAVTHWAEVTCGTHRFGTTPFADRQLPAGTYDCVFRNPELGSKTGRVEVRANQTQKVTVKF